METINLNMRGKCKMENLKNNILVSMNERKNELVSVASDFIRGLAKNKDVMYSSDMAYMKDMIEDIERLYDILASLDASEEWEKMDEDEIMEIVSEHIEFEKSHAESEYERFLEERSFEE